jgi:glyoxylase-like metal-dependent hydrolase (beta-lactamase superfamily II)
MKEIAVSLLRAGHTVHPRGSTIRGGGWRLQQYPALAALLIHPQEGPILFDTGYDPAFIAATDPFPERLYRWLTPPRLAPGEEIAAQLERRGVAPADLAHIVVSHFHADHAAGLRRFPRAAVHCARAGLAPIASASRLAALRAGLPRGLLPDDIARRARFFEDAPRTALPRDLAPFETGADLLGDGTLLAVELPGHCPGHWGLVVRDARVGLHFLVADAAWSSDAIRRDCPPPAAVAALLGDVAQGRETLHRLHALQARNRDVVLTPSHCLERAAEVEITP